MKKQNFRLYLSVCMLLFFSVWTVLISIVDVQAIGPMQSTVGFATVNKYIHNLTGVHLQLYSITDYLSIIPLGIMCGLGLLGLMQLIKGKSIKRVDYSILVLGGFYIIVLAMYLLFEILIINCRPILIDGVLEASYPSSTTMLVMCVIPTAIMQFNTRIKVKKLRLIVASLLYAFMIFMVVCRLISGVHWFTDILGGAFLSIGLVEMYSYLINKGTSF